MKRISSMLGAAVVSATVLLAACAAHPVKCQGPLRPINQPGAVQPRTVQPGAAGTKPLTGSATTRVPHP